LEVVQVLSGYLGKNRRVPGKIEKVREGEEDELLSNYFLFRAGGGDFGGDFLSGGDEEGSVHQGDGENFGRDKRECEGGKKRGNREREILCSRGRWG
jgi:hypothetical protein